MGQLPKSVFVVLVLLTFSACFYVYTGIRLGSLFDNVRGPWSLDKLQEYFIGTLTITAPFTLAALGVIAAVRSFAVKVLSVVIVFVMTLTSLAAFSRQALDGRGLYLALTWAFGFACAVAAIITALATPKRINNLPKSVFVILVVLTFSASFFVYTGFRLGYSADYLRGTWSLDKVQRLFMEVLICTAPFILAALSTTIAVRSFAVKFLSVVIAFVMTLTSWGLFSLQGSDVRGLYFFLSWAAGFVCAVAAIITALVTPKSAPSNQHEVTW